MVPEGTASKAMLLSVNRAWQVATLDVMVQYLRSGGSRPP